MDAPNLAVKSLEHFLLGQALETEVSPGMTVSLEVATIVDHSFSTLCAWILECDPKALDIQYRMREPMLQLIPEFPRKPQQEMEVMFQDVGRSAAFTSHSGSLASLLEGVGVGRGVFRDGWRGWSCRWAVRTAGQPRLD